MATSISPRIELLGWADARPAASIIRTVVFMDEQRVPAELEWDEWDDASLHALAWVGAEAVGTARLRPDGKIGRMAVLPPWRGQGIGRALLRAVIAEARRQGLRELQLDAQIHAQGFYQREGFSAEGEEFLDAGIRHRHMRRTLSGS